MVVDSKLKQNFVLFKKFIKIGIRFLNLINKTKMLFPLKICFYYVNSRFFLISLSHSVSLNTSVCCNRATLFIPKSNALCENSQYCLCIRYIIVLHSVHHISYISRPTTRSKYNVCILLSFSYFTVYILWVIRPIFQTLVIYLPSFKN